MVFMSEEGYVGLAKQIVSGGRVTPAHFLYVNSVAIDPEESLLIPDPEIGSGRDIVDAFVGPIKWTGSLEFNLRPEAFGLLLLGATGAVTSSGINGDAKGHLFTFENDLIPLSIEKRVGDGLEVFAYTDTKINTLRIECAAGELATGSAEVIAITEESDIAESVESFETAPIFTWAGGSITIDSEEIPVKNFSFEINNNLVDDDFRIGQRKLGSLTEKRRELTASFDIVPLTSDTYKKAVYGSTGASSVSGNQQTFSAAVHIKLESADGVYVPGTSQKYEFELDIPKAIFRSAPLPTSGDDLIVQTLEMLPIKGTEAIATIVLRNGVSSY